MMPILNLTPHTEKQTTKPIVASHTTNTMLKANCRSIGAQNDPTSHEHVVQNPHATLCVVLPVLTHLSTHVIRNYLLIRIVSLYGQLDPVPWLSIPPKPHLL
jgi:hypothetical protein